MSAEGAVAGRARAVHRVGTRAVLVDLADLGDVMTWHAALSAEPLPEQRGVVAAASTILLTTNTPAAAADAFAFLRDFAPTSAARESGREITLDVVYDGEDLAALADSLGLTPDSLIEKHTAETWTGAFGGFAPGFTYCIAESGDWDVPRRDSPRTAVPPGSVALAGEFSAVYPRRTPGGWQLIGRTDTPMWDESAEPPALIAPGDTVRYRAVRPRSEAGAGPDGADHAAPVAGEDARADAGGHAAPSGETVSPSSAGPRDRAAAGRPVLTVEDSGLLTLVEDLGRPGYGDLGVASSGVVDRGSAWTANRLVGNGGGAALLENIGGLRITALVDTVVAVTGAEAPLTVIPGRTSGAGEPRRHRLAHPVLLRTGDELTVGPGTQGMRSYLAVRGGLAAAEVLGSAATDLLSGLGPDPVKAGDTLRVRNRPPTGGAAADGRSSDPEATVSGGGSGGDSRPATGVISAVGGAEPNPLRVTGPGAAVRCVLGPRADWFAPAEQARFARVSWEVTGESNRVGLRLAPGDDEAPLEREREGELASEGMISGAVQVPPNGRPVVFLADHPVTGGYPVIATVVAEDLDVLGQLPPGARLTFVPVDPTDLAPLASADAPAGQDADAPAGHEADAPADGRSVPAETEDSP